MSAKKPDKSKKDRHKSGFMVRLPEEYRATLKESTHRNRRAITSTIQIAIDYAVKNGVI